MAGLGLILASDQQRLASAANYGQTFQLSQLQVIKSEKAAPKTL